MSTAIISKEKILKKYSDFIMMLIPAKKLIRGLKNASYLTIGHIITLAISFIGIIYIARILGPNNFGIYTIVVAFVGMFDIITVYGINKVVLREGSKDLSQMQYYIEKTTGIKNLFTFVAVGFCIIASFFTPYSTQVILYIFIFSFSLIYTSFNGFFMTVFQAAEKMQYNAFLSIIHRILFVSLSIVFLYMGFGLFALFIIALFSQFFTLIINFKLTKNFLSYKFWNGIKVDKTILKPAIIFSILAFSYLLAGKIDLVMISLLGSSSDVGIYGVSYRIMMVGLTLRSFISTAFFPIFVKSYSKRSVRFNRLLKYALIMGLVLLSIATVISFYSEQIITPIFGGEYFESGTIFSVLVFYVAISFFIFPFTNTLQATHNESTLLKICWIAPSLNIGLNYLFFKAFGLIGIAYSTLVVGCISLPLYVIITRRALKNQNKLI